MAVCKISENSQKITCESVLFWQSYSSSFFNFIKIGSQHECFPENASRFSEELFLCKIFGQLFLNFQAIVIVPAHLYMGTCGKWVSGCNGSVVRYDFEGIVDSQSIVMIMNLFLHVHFTY